MKLPHSQHVEARTASEILDWLSSEKQEIYLAVSKDFYDLGDRENFEEIYDRYRTYFHSVREAVASIAGPPSWQGWWEEDEYPDWAVGEEIAVWQEHEPPMYLRIHQEDREVPIIIALSRIEDGA
jgi:hypothetical protein